MKSGMALLILMSICFSAHTYSMEQDNSRAVNNALKAQKLYNEGQEVLSAMEWALVLANFSNEEACNMFVATKKSEANNLFCKSRRRIQEVLNDKNSDEVTRKTVLDIEKKIDAIPWASK